MISRNEWNSIEVGDLIYEHHKNLSQDISIVIEIDVAVITSIVFFRMEDTVRYIQEKAMYHDHVNSFLCKKVK